MADVKDGGPAFPVPYEKSYDAQGRAHEGMSLHDYFAGQAMAAYLAVADEDHGPQARVSPARVAQWAYENADAMLTARTRTHSELAGVRAPEETREL